MPTHPGEGQFSAELAAGSVLVISGRELAADDRRLLGAFVAQLRVAQERDRMRETAEEVASLSESNELRTALSPRHAPDRVVQVPAVPRNLTGKKLELPVKRILQGSPVAAVASVDALHDPGCLDPFAALAAERTRGRR